MLRTRRRSSGRTCGIGTPLTVRNMLTSWIVLHTTRLCLQGRGWPAQIMPKGLDALPGVEQRVLENRRDTLHRLRVVDADARAPVKSRAQEWRGLGPAKHGSQEKCACTYRLTVDLEGKGLSCGPLAPM